MRRTLTYLAISLTPLFAPILAMPAHAADADLHIHAPYVRIAPPGAAATGAFMRIENAGAADRQLVKAESPAAKTVELHTHVNEGGMMKMREVPSIAIKAGGQTELKPGSYHVMLIGLTQPLKDGELVPITLTFDDGSQQRISAPARPIHTESHTGSHTTPAGHGGMKH